MNNEEIKSKILKIIKLEDEENKKRSIDETDNFINEIIAHIFTNMGEVVCDEKSLTMTVKAKDLMLLCAMLISYFSLSGEFSAPIMDNILFADTLNNVFKFIKDGKIREGISYLNKKKGNLKLKTFFDEHQDKVFHA